MEPRHITLLQLASKRLLKLCRDNTFWRSRCYEESSFLKGIKLRRGPRFPDGLDELLATTAANVQGGADPVPTVPLDVSWDPPKVQEQERIRIAANWDPTFPGERPNWYDEYIHRNAPIAVSWFEQPRAMMGDVSTATEVTGVAVYQHGDDEVFAVSPLEDGSVCIWDVKGTRRKKGAILAKSESCLLYPHVTDPSKRSQRPSNDVTECVSVDSQRNRAFFAVQGRTFHTSHPMHLSPLPPQVAVTNGQADLLEIDLETLRVVGNQPFEWTITALSSAQPAVPLTVGTFHGLHLFDHRTPKSGLSWDCRERIDSFDRDASRDFASILSQEPLPAYAPLAQSGPHSILHFECPGSKELSDDIFVAGRFASILNYDRRMFPTIKGSIWSGASLCGLASLPYPFSSLDSDLRRRGELSMEQVKKAKSIPGGRTLIACGGYNTKGSLELYGLGPQDEAVPGVKQNSIMQNRQTASNSKLLSVINHGTRIVVSDGQGCLRWMERDGFTEVRRHQIGHAEKMVQRSLFASMPGSEEIARKLVSTQPRLVDESRANRDDILFWTGEKLGLATFSSKPGFTADAFEEAADMSAEELEEERQAQLHREKMRQALEQQAKDARFVHQLGGIGIR